MFEGLKLVGFKPRSCLKRYYHVKQAQFVYPDESVRFILPHCEKKFERQSGNHHVSLQAHLFRNCDRLHFPDDRRQHERVFCLAEEVPGPRRRAHRQLHSAQKHSTEIRSTPTSGTRRFSMLTFRQSLFHLQELGHLLCANLSMRTIVLISAREGTSALRTPS